MECPRVEPIGLLDVVIRREDGEIVFDMETTDHLRVERYDVIYMIAQRTGILVDGSYLVLVSPCHLGLLQVGSMDDLDLLPSCSGRRRVVVLQVSIVVTVHTVLLLDSLQCASTSLTRIAMIGGLSFRDSLKSSCRNPHDYLLCNVGICNGGKTVVMMVVPETL